MTTQNDLNKAANDLNYRIFYESEQMRAAIKRPIPKGEPAKKTQPKQADAWFICTELHRHGLLSRDDYRLGLRSATSI